ncbi:NHL repeat-containing protein [Mucilaginibacter mallensis]|uniref:NHL repeat-containing protein n=1 Tax=Mucilaginibacter mallensis TaxID=652787 RepID=A0A1H1VBU5_MUCMA|nr:hypothetical protein [Mucilaginibacter mallensis]SDS82143.1 NHL repeat-containing protein [Mucilaginibacter mallensis]
MRKTLFVLLIAVSFITACKKSNKPNPSTAAKKIIVSTVGGLGDPEGLTIDVSGNLYVANGLIDNIGKITSAGAISIFAGKISTNGTSSCDYENGIGNAAAFCNPVGIAADGLGNLYVADAGNGVIRKISSGAAVTTYALSGVGIGEPYGIAIDRSDNIYITDPYNSLIYKVSPNGIASIFAGSGVAGNNNGLGTASSFNRPLGLTIDAVGNIYVADQANNVIRKITPAGMVSTFAGTGTAGNTNGNVTAASFDSPSGIAIDAAGNIYVADSGNDLIRKISTSGMVSTYAGNGSEGTTNGVGEIATFSYPTAVVVDKDGNLYIGEANSGLIRKIVVQ